MDSTSVVAMVVIIVVLMVPVFVAVMIGMSRLVGTSSTEQVNIQQFQAGLIKHLPPDVQAEINQKKRRVVALLAFCLIVVPSMAVGFILSGRGNRGIITSCASALVIMCVAWLGAIVRTWLKRRNPGEVLADLSPHPLAGAVRRNAWRMWVVCAVMVSMTTMSMVTGHQWLFLVVQLAFLLLSLLAILLYSDRVWLTERGLFIGGTLRPWHAFERVAWTDDGRAFALRRKKSHWFSGRWVIVPVHEGARDGTEEALRQVMPAPVPSR